VACLIFPGRDRAGKTATSRPDPTTTATTTKTSTPSRCLSIAHLFGGGPTRAVFSSPPLRCTSILDSLSEIKMIHLCTRRWLFYSYRYSLIVNNILGTCVRYVNAPQRYTYINVLKLKMYTRFLVWMMTRNILCETSIRCSRVIIYGIAIYWNPI